MLYINVGELKMNNEWHTYEVSFIVDQRGDYIEWLEDALRQGLRDGETIQQLQINLIPQYELTEQ